MFLDEVIAAKKAGLTEVSAKVQELRMAECKPLKRTDAARLAEPPSNLKYEVAGRNMHWWSSGINSEAT